MKRTDENQIEIVKTLRQTGISVAVTSNLGDGFPDIVTGGLMPCPHCSKKFPQTKLVEIKSEKGILPEPEVTGSYPVFKEIVDDYLDMLGDDVTEEDTIIIRKVKND